MFQYMIHEIPLFIIPCECDGLATSLKPLCPPSAHIRITLSSGTLVNPSTGVRGCKQMDASTDKGTSTIVIPMYLASKRNEMRGVKPWRYTVVRKINVWVTSEGTHAYLLNALQGDTFYWPHRGTQVFSQRFWPLFLEVS